MVKKQRGQALVETGLIMPVVLVAILMLTDLAFFGINQGLGWYYSFKAAREASIFLQDGTKSCYQEARNAAFGGLGGAPALFMVGMPGTSWEFTVEPCPDDSSWSPSSNVPVTATLRWHQKAVWWGNWDGDVFATDVSQ